MENVYQEIKTRNSPIIIITSNDKCEMENSIILPYNSTFDDLLSVIPLQLFAFELSMRRNLNPDFPRNLAKSVVVE